MNERSYDIVLWGATGFTGRLVAEYFAERYEPSNLNWALAGRNREKLNKLKSFLTDVDPGWADLPILLGDALDQNSLEEIARKTKVICSTVGPYAEYGTNMVAACVNNRTDYCDLTGEIQWIREMIDQFHEEAQKKEVRIVHSCGFDSIPSDIGTLMVQEHAKKAYGVPCSRIRAFMSMGGAEFSGGTFASMLKIFEDATCDSKVRQVLTDPYGLNPEEERPGPDGPVQWKPRYDDDLQMWTAPFLMALSNEKIVRRSNAVLNYPYGKDFEYGECMPMGSGWGGVLRAAGISVSMGLFTGAMALGPIRKLLKKFVLPDSGQGPDRETRESGSFEVRLVGQGTNLDTGESFRTSGKITGNRDPGYGSTAWMLGESAVCLALGETNTPMVGGILTPASGIGMPLVDRLERTGLIFRTADDSS